MTGRCCTARTRGTCEIVIVLTIVMVMIIIVVIIVYN